MLKKIFFLSAFTLILFHAGASPAVENDLLNLKDIPTQDRFALTDRQWPESYGEAKVCLWANDRLAAVSVDIDDNCRPDHEWWIAMGQRYGWKFTWFIIVHHIVEGISSFFGTWDDFRLLFSLGHDVQNHTYDHNHYDNLRTEPEVDLSYRLGKEFIEAHIPGNSAVTLAYPAGRGQLEIAARYHIAARGVNGVPNRANRTAYLWANVGELSNKDVDQLLNPASIYWRGWLSPLFHNITGAEEIDKQAAKAAMERVFDYIKSKERDIWFETFKTITMYGQERDTHTLTVNGVSNELISFTLTDLMHNDYFTCPLTVKVRLDDDWDGLAATQGGQAISAGIVLHDGRKYALVQAVPDAGEVLLTKSSPAAVSAPVIEPNYTDFDYLVKGNFKNSAAVTMSCLTSGAEIRYTLDGSEPDEGSLLYEHPIVLTDNATVRAAGRKAGLAASPAAAAVFKIDADSAPPALSAVSSVGNPRQVIISFNEAIEQTTAQQAANYTINNDTAIAGAALLADKRTVLLSTSEMTSGASYTLTVSGIQDLSNNSMPKSATAQFTCSVPEEQEHLAAYWSFDDEHESSVANDFSGHGNPGIIYGGKRAPGIRGSGIYFDGIDDYIDAGTAKFGLDVSNELTVSFWFQMKGGASGDFIQRGDGYVWPFRIQPDPSRHIKTVVRTASTNYLNGATYLHNDLWYCCALTYKNGSRALYVNGRTDGESTLEGTLGISAGARTCIGQGFNGIIDEVRIYDRALAQQEIESLYTSINTPLSTTTTMVGPTTSTTTVAPPDADNDSIYDAVDNCPNTCNPQQLDADSDGSGDVCDTTPGCGGCGLPACDQHGECDADHDSIPDASDNCPNAANPQQLDADSDGSGDACDPSPGCGGCGQPACEEQFSRPAPEKTPPQIAPAKRTEKHALRA